MAAMCNSIILLHFSNYITSIIFTDCTIEQILSISRKEGVYMKALTGILIEKEQS